MDTIRDQKQKKKESEPTLEKQSQDNITKDLGDKFYYLNGELIEIADDLLDLPEFDYDNPEMKAWMDEEDAEFRRKFPNLTHEEAGKKIDRILAELAEKAE